MVNRLKYTDIRNFVLAGKANFTVENVKTLNYFTFKVNKPKSGDENSPWFVSVLTGNDNLSSYTYIGCVFPSDMEFKLTKKSSFSEDVQSVKVEKFIFSMIKKNSYHRDIAFYHTGKCGKCGRKLTIPDSIDRGLGPVCISNKKDSVARQRMKKINKLLKE